MSQFLLMVLACFVALVLPAVCLGVVTAFVKKPGETDNLAIHIQCSRCGHRGGYVNMRTTSETYRRLRDEHCD